MQLNVLERLTLLSILPQEGNFLTLKLMRELKESLSFTEEEHKHYNFKQEEGKVYWDNDNELKEIKIGEKATDIIIEILKKLDEQKKLKVEQFSLYEKFVAKN